MKTEVLIRELAKHSSPVKRIGDPVIRFYCWAVVAGVCVTIGVAVLGLRQDLSFIWQNPKFLLQVALTLVLGTVSGRAAFVLSVPHQARRSWVLFSVFVSLLCLIWAVILTVMLFLSGSGQAGPGVSCLRDIVVIGVAPGFLLFCMLRKAAPLQIGTVGFLAAMAMAALGALGTQLVCRNDGPLHILLWHYVPTLVVGVFGILLGQLLFRWERRYSILKRSSEAPSPE